MNAVVPHIGSKHKRAQLMTGIIGIIGVVYGDIGTSPLYALQAAFGTVSAHGVAASLADVTGIAGMIFWVLTLVVSIKYVSLVMRASYNGEGGIIALMSLAQRTVRTVPAAKLLGVVGIGGCCLFFGDAIITPAISVLSALEGIQVMAPAAKDIVIPCTILILAGLFSLQALGSNYIGRAFGPIMLAWFLTLAAMGVYGIAQTPEVLWSLSPTQALGFSYRHPVLAFLCLGSVVLSVTGAEALYADIGHFSPDQIRYTWLLFVFPALVLNYLGQAGAACRNPHALANPFYHLAPQWAQYPLLALATLATITASQAGISGTFSLCRQLVQLGYIPRIRVLHTNPNEESQIYLPLANRILALSSILLVLFFRSSEALSAAYGIAVTGTFLCTTLLCIVVFKNQFMWSQALTFIVFGFFGLLDLLFFAANFLKIGDGGWIPLLVALIMATIMFTWEEGRRILDERRRADSIPLRSFLSRLEYSKTFAHVSGYAIYLSSDSEVVPNAFLYNLRYNKVLHDQLLLVTVQTVTVPEVPKGERLTVAKLAPGIFKVVVRYGFMEPHDLPQTLRLLSTDNIDFDTLQAIYFISYEHALPSRVPKMSAWRQQLFLYMLRHSVSIEEFYQIPPERAVEFGVRVTL